MRTVGTLSDIVNVARDYYNDTETGRPMNPVVRRREEDKKWMLESELCDASDSDLEISLDSFDQYFYEMYTTNNIELSDYEEDDFVRILKNY